MEVIGRADATSATVQGLEFSYVAAPGADTCDQCVALCNQVEISQDDDGAS
jgi:hypothetical protein